MTLYVYPRLPFATARARISELAHAHATGGLDAVARLSDVSHPKAAPVATGGRVADMDRIADLRKVVVASVERWLQVGEVTRVQAAAFDLELGRVLHEHLDIVPADAAHVETWSFLTLIVLPDVAVVRFPDLHADRLIGTQRNVLRRTWIREEILGDILRSGGRPLGEDELVGIFERTALARNRRLVRSLAKELLTYDGTTSRSYWARELYKRVIYMTGPRLLDALSDEELDALVLKCAAEVVV